jgi:peptide/nickel transport system permease protein
MAETHAPPRETTLDIAPPDVGPSRPGGRRRWVRNLELIVPVTILVLLFGVCFVGPLVLPIPEPTGGSVLETSLPAGTEGHLLGTDSDGNDIFSRLLHGGQVSLLIALAVNIIGLVAGGTIGSFAAYMGGIYDAVLMRVLDVFIAFPALIIAIAIAQSFDRNPVNTVWALCFFSVPAFARLSRASTLRLREQVFITAAKLSGTRTPRVLLRHVAPNIIPQLVTFALLGMGLIMIIEGALSFLGLGVQPPNPSWGSMIRQGSQSLASSAGIVLFPSIALFVAVLGFNLLGETLRSRWSAQ